MLKLKYYGTVLNAGNAHVSSSLPYNDLGPGRWGTPLNPGQKSAVYPIANMHAAAAMSTADEAEIVPRSDGSKFIVLTFKVLEFGNGGAVAKR